MIITNNHWYEWDMICMEYQCSWHLPFISQENQLAELSPETPQRAARAGAGAVDADAMGGAYPSDLAIPWYGWMVYWEKSYGKNGELGELRPINMKCRFLLGNMKVWLEKWMVFDWNISRHIKTFDQHAEQR